MEDAIPFNGVTRQDIGKPNKPPPPNGRSVKGKLLNKQDFLRRKAVRESRFLSYSLRSTAVNMECPVIGSMIGKNPRRIGDVRVEIQKKIFRESIWMDTKGHEPRALGIEHLTERRREFPTDYDDTTI
jgi:hypothetical protein